MLFVSIIVIKGKYIPLFEEFISGMLDIASRLPSAFGTNTHAAISRWDDMAASAIFVLGSARSGTSWLAKIFDSHPDILYRHEPDEVVLPKAGVAPRRQVAEWLSQRSLRVAAKRPSFRKSFRPLPLQKAREVAGWGLAAAQRSKLLPNVTDAVTLPDMIPGGSWASVRAAVKLVNWDGTVAARAMPDSRGIFILRHPCGQVGSILSGLAGNRFANTAGKSGLEDGLAYAAQRGIDPDLFTALPLSAQYAWAWLAFNEPAIQGLQALPNARIVIYEDLCRHPETIARDLFSFAGLRWHRQTAAFLSASTSGKRDTGYFDVFRHSDLVAGRWRETMDPTDQAAIRGVVASSPLAHCWPDLSHRR